MANGFGPPPVVVESDANQRRHGRVRCELTRSNLGKVLDVSASGAKIRRRGRGGLAKGQKVLFVIEGLDGPIYVNSEVAWVKRRGLLAFEVGVRFEHVTAKAKKDLALLARNSAWTESFEKLREAA